MITIAKCLKNMKNNSYFFQTSTNFKLFVSQTLIHNKNFGGIYVRN